MYWRSGFRYITYCLIGGLTLSVCRKLNWNGLLEELFEVFGVVPYIDWLNLGFEGAFGGILLM